MKNHSSVEVVRLFLLKVKTDKETCEGQHSRTVSRHSLCCCCATHSSRMVKRCRSVVFDENKRIRKQSIERKRERDRQKKSNKENETLCVTHLFILISRDGDELGLLEDISAKRAVGQLKDVVGAHQMKSRLVLVHRIQYRLL